MLNKVMLQGRLVADPELRHTQSGSAVATFRLAVERDYKDKNTGKREADFINVVAWLRTGEFVSRYVTKGRMIVVEGRLQSRTWKDSDGSNRYATEVVAASVYFADDAKKKEEKKEPEFEVPEFSDMEDDDGTELPF